MIIWQGYGFLVILSPLAYMAVLLSLSSVFGNDYLSHHSWPGALAFLVTAAVIWGFHVASDKPPRTLLDPQTGQTVEFKRRHTFFFIPLKYVSAILVLVALWVLIFKSSSAV